MAVYIRYCLETFDTLASLISLAFGLTIGSYLQESRPRTLFNVDADWPASARPDLWSKRPAYICTLTNPLVVNLRSHNPDLPSQVLQESAPQAERTIHAHVRLWHYSDRKFHSFPPSSKPLVASCPSLPSIILLNQMNQ
jgi:hypothetical protein